MKKYIFILLIILSCQKDEEQISDIVETRSGVLDVFYQESFTKSNYLKGTKNVQTVYNKNLIDSVTFFKVGSLAKIGEVLNAHYAISIYFKDSEIKRDVVYSKYQSDLFTIVPTGTNELNSINRNKVQAYERQTGKKTYFDLSCGNTRNMYGYRIFINGRLISNEFIPSTNCISEFYTLNHK
jgi:hypothetical protein